MQTLLWFRWRFTAEIPFRSQDSLCGVCGAQSGTETGCSHSSWVFPCQSHSTIAPHSFMYYLSYIILSIDSMIFDLFGISSSQFLYSLTDVCGQPVGHEHRLVTTVFRCV